MANVEQPRDRRQAYGQVLLLCWGVFGFFNTPVVAWLVFGTRLGVTFSGIHRLDFGRNAFAEIFSFLIFERPGRNFFVVLPVLVAVLVARSIWLSDLRLAVWGGWLAVGSVAAWLPFQIPFGTLSASRWLSFGLMSVVALLLPVLGLGLVTVPERFGDLFLGTRDGETMDHGPMTQVNTLAVASLTLALLGGAFFASVPGHIALRRIDRSNGREKGRSQAVAGILLGHLGSLVLALLLILKLFSRGW